MFKKILFFLILFFNFKNCSSQDLEFYSMKFEEDSNFVYYLGYLYNDSNDSCILFSFAPNTSFNYKSINSFDGRIENETYVLYSTIGEFDLDHLLKYVLLYSKKNLFVKFKVPLNNIKNKSVKIVFNYSKISNNIIKKSNTIDIVRLRKKLGKVSLMQRSFWVQ